MTITGSDFGSVQGTVTFGDISATSYPSWSDTQIVCITPAHTAEIVDVVVTADNSLSGTKTSAFTYIDPLDFGDAPEPMYPSAMHPINGVIYLGNQVDAEPNSQPNATALYHQ